MKKIGLVIFSLLLALLVFAGIQSPEYRIERSVLIDASASSIFPYVNNSRKTYEWMPWGKTDPEMKMSYSGPDEGVGSVSTWTSPGEMGDGKAEVIESIADESVKTQLTYVRPMEMSQIAEITLSSVGEQTRVTWSVEGKNGFIGRLFCLFMNMDKMVGSEFEKGLQSLKDLVEGASSL